MMTIYSRKFIKFRTALRNFIKQTPLYTPLKLLAQKVGRPVTPPHVKQNTLGEYGDKYNLHILVETGTFQGDMIAAMRDKFDRIYSIELSNELYEKAKERFKSDQHIQLIQGDSGKALEDLMGKINEPALFWLDAHYSSGITAKGEEDTPIYNELRHIFNAQDLEHIIIIDDARLFGTDAAYPTIDELKKFILSRKRDVNITINDDMVKVVPNAYSSVE